MKPDTTQTVTAEVVYEGVLSVTPDHEGEELDAHRIVEEVFDTAMRELLELDGVTDPSVTGSIASGTLEISLVTEGATFPAAVSNADAAIRAALHAAGVCTPEWEHPVDRGYVVEWQQQHSQADREPIDA